MEARDEEGRVLESGCELSPEETTSAGESTELRIRRREVATRGRRRGGEEGLVGRSRWWEEELSSSLFPSSFARFVVSTNAIAPSLTPKASPLIPAVSLSLSPPLLSETLKSSRSNSSSRGAGVFLSRAHLLLRVLPFDFPPFPPRTSLTRSTQMLTPMNLQTLLP